MLFILMTGLYQCKIESVSQPATAQCNDTIRVEILVRVNYPDANNPIKGFLGMLVPDDWQLLSGEYSSEYGSGQLLQSAEWTDSVNFHYPPETYGDALKWIGCISEYGHTAPSAHNATVSLALKVGQREGLFNIGYIFTKAYENMLGTNSAAISFPHQISVPDSSYYPEFNPWQFSVKMAEDWDELLNRTSGWTGADGIQTFPLSGSEVYSESAPGRTLFDFSDSFIGDVDNQGIRINPKMVNNTLALLDGNQPDPSAIQFKWALKSNGEPRSIFIPDSPNTVAGDWFWPMDGLTLGDTTHIFAMRMYSAGDGMWGFAIRGVTLLSFTVDSVLNISTPVQRELPLLYDEASDIQTVFGAAVMPLTERSGWPNPDGYVYVYGIRSRPNNKDLVAARVLESYLADVSKWTFYNGSEWVADIAQCAPLTDQISQEMSVSPLPNGQFIAVFQLNSNFEKVAVRIGDTPVGPFSLYKTIYTCPEVDEFDDAFCYNAKAHPHLSKPGELLISYNVNILSGWDVFKYADIYHPRFIRIRFGESNPVAVAEEPFAAARDFALQQNYPNPFNALTRIGYRLPLAAELALNIYNLNGSLLRTLAQGHSQPGDYQVNWDGRDNAGRELPSGVYFYVLQYNDRSGAVQRECRKLVLLK